MPSTTRLTFTPGLSSFTGVADCVDQDRWIMTVAFANRSIVSRCARSAYLPACSCMLCTHIGCTVPDIVSAVETN